MPTEWIFIAGALADLLFVFLAARLGREWLLCSVIANLLLIVAFGAKLISIWGFVTNVGNVPYACVFLAADFLLERYGWHEGQKTIWLGAGVVTFFVVMAQLLLAIPGLELSSAANIAAESLFSFVPRIFIGSMLAYIAAQYVNLWLYNSIQARTGRRYLWLRVNGANIVAQLFDSAIFFSIAFFGLQEPLIIEAMVAGWIIKVLVVACGTPLLYFESLFPPPMR